MLKTEAIIAGYGFGPILREVSIEVAPGEVVALLGRNGMGKTTVLRTIMGVLVPDAGNVYFQDRRISGLKPFQIARQGIAYVPEEKRIFGSLTVRENVQAAAYATGKALTAAETALATFPDLVERPDLKAAELSGGQRQMLAVARALATQPRLVLFDEPMQGLAPVFVRLIAQTIRNMRDAGIGVLLVEQSVKLALELADRVYILNRGGVVFAGGSADLAGQPTVVEEHLSVGSLAEQ